MSSCGSLAKTFALGAGCYWGTEKYVKYDFQKLFPNTIARATVGFMSPNPNAIPNPTYRQVCSGVTGHIEVLNIELTEDGATEDTFEELIRFFFMFHDPTTKNRQGNDAGTQYASVIFTNDESQSRIAQKVKGDLQKLIDSKKVRSYSRKKVETLITNANTFYEAHAEHQDYLKKNPYGYCNHYMRFKQWPSLSNDQREGQSGKTEAQVNGNALSKFLSIIWKKEAGDRIE